MRKKVSMIAVPLLLVSVIALAQALITGQIRDANGQPVPFASVKIKGKGVGVSADQNGNFSIKIGKHTTLIVSAPGFKKQEVRAENTMVITLKNASNLQVLQQDIPLLTGGTANPDD